MSERFQFDADDRALLRAASELLKKAATAATTTPAQLVSIAKLQHVISALPRVTAGVEVSVSVSSPSRTFGKMETWHWWIFAAGEQCLEISSGGHLYLPDRGGDTFTTMRWAAYPQEPTELHDYRASLFMVPDVRSFPDGVASIDFASGGYSIEITDDDNPLLEVDVESEEDEELDDHAENEMEADSYSVEDPPAPWSLSPVDAVEEALASMVDRECVNAHKPDYAFGVQNCDFCGCVLAERGLFVDGRLRGAVKWANMCAACFRSHAEGIGWGNGQLYARQPEGKWRMVAGWSH